MQSASVAINNYNYGRFLRRAIDSVLAQTRKPIDIIVVDDGSTDDSPEIIRSYGERITPVLKANGGHASAFNAGYALARGDVVFFLDSDDSMYPQAIETVLDAWKPGVVMVHYLMHVVDPEGKILGIHPPPPHRLAEGDVRAELLEHGGFATTLTSGLAFSREALAQVMPIDEKIFVQAADGYLVHSLPMLGPVQAIAQCLARQCRHGSNDSEFGKDFQGLLKSTRRQMRYMRNEIDTVYAMAKRLGLSAAKDLANSDAAYLEYRICSLKLDPEGHPLPSDDLWHLLAGYTRARWNQHDKAARRVAEIGLTTAASLLPRDLAASLLLWKHVPKSRPAWLRIPDVLRR